MEECVDMMVTLNRLEYPHALALMAGLGDRRTCEIANLPLRERSSAERFVEGKLRDRDTGDCLPYIVAIDGGIAGYACLTFGNIPWEGQLSFAVFPFLRGIGMGRAICELLLERLAAMPARTVATARCRSWNRTALHLLDSLGFEPVDPRHDGTIALTLRLRH